jgi:hypothetical protein
VLSKCDRVIQVQTPHRMLCLDSDAKKIWPGHAQWRFDMPESADTVTFTFTTLGAGAVCNNLLPSAASLAPKLQLAVRSDGMPITWDVSGAGSYERLVDVQQGTANNSWTATVSLARTKRHHVMLVNSGGPRIAQNITLTLSCAAADGCPVTDGARWWRWWNDLVYAHRLWLSRRSRAKVQLHSSVWPRWVVCWRRCCVVGVNADSVPSHERARPDLASVPGIARSSSGSAQVG